MSGTPLPMKIVSSSSDERVLIPDNLVDQPLSVSSDKVFSVRIGLNDWEFAQEHLDAFPKLKDPSARFRLNFEPIYRLILGYPASAIPQDLLDTPSEKEIFLSNCAFFDIKLSPDVIVHLCSDKKKELMKASAEIQKHGSKKKQAVFWLKKKVQSFCEAELSSFSDLYEGLSPLDIVRHLEIGSEDLINKLLVHDWEVGKGSVSSFLQKFMSKFFP